MSASSCSRGSGESAGVCLGNRQDAVEPCQVDPFAIVAAHVANGIGSLQLGRHSLHRTEPRSRHRQAVCVEAGVPPARACEPTQGMAKGLQAMGEALSDSLKTGRQR